MAQECAVDGCERTGPFTRGYCKAHYMRVLRHGEPGDPIPTTGDLRGLIDKRGEDECWEFKGARDDRGYGRISRQVYPESLAHRMAWSLENPGSPMPEVVMHDCDNPPCCNPNHLMAGTRLKNNQQAWARGLHRRGEGHHSARLTDADVRTIRDRFAGGERQIDLADEYGCTQSHLSKVVNFQVRRAA